MPWSQFLDTKDNGFRFLPFDELKEAFDEQAGWNEDAEWTIQYCRTNQRSTVTGIVANVILYPLFGCVDPTAVQAAPNE